MDKTGEQLVEYAGNVSCLAEKNLKLDPEEVNKTFVNSIVEGYKVKYFTQNKLAEAAFQIENGSNAMNNICKRISDKLTDLAKNPDNQAKNAITLLTEECKNIAEALESHKASHNELCNAGDDIMKMRIEAEGQYTKYNQEIQNFEGNSDCGKNELTTVDGAGFVIYRHLEKNRSILNVFTPSSKAKTKECLGQAVMEANKKSLKFISDTESQLNDQRKTVKCFLEAVYPVESHAKLSLTFLKSYLAQEHENDSTKEDNKRTTKQEKKTRALLEAQNLIQACNAYTNTYVANNA